ncbi:hypothetical protein PIB30_051068 [Stylosanthes scabra]|uniref:Uncharacterized protein n=1 Tax=Stylosanthes scabra TaxID=79078 RepID=A0ABU6VH18_9FABA|nr:hypothetical protein [Stylosanthes scabra]
MSQVEYTPLGHETIPVLVSTSCPVDASIMAASSSDLAPFKPEMSLISPIKEVAINEEVPVAPRGKPKSEGPFPSGGSQGHVPPQNLPEQSTVDRATIVEKVNKVLGCLNHSLEEIVASTEVKSQLLEAITFLSQHASSEASSLESFMEDLYNSNILLESSSADLRAAKDDLSKHKKNITKYDAALLKVKPLVDMGFIKEQEARSLEETQRLRVEELEKELLLAKQNMSNTMAGLAKIKATNHNLKNALLGIEQKRASSTSKHTAAIKAVEEAEAKHKQAVETSSKLSKRQEELKLAFRSFLN